MNRKYLYAGLLFFFMLCTAFVLLRYHLGLHNRVVAFFPLQERQGVLKEAPDWSRTQSTAARLIRLVRDNQTDHKSALALATLYIQEGRITGNHAYYDKAALHYIDRLLQKDPGHFEALTLKALVQLSQHRFSDGLATAQAARKINPYNAFVYGLMVDAYVELGDYGAAVEAADRMVSIRPDIRSYSRIAYLREIHGDYPGAVEAMQMAVDAGGYGDEPTAWTRVQLARLYEATGDRPRADLQYRRALEERPGYPFAEGGLAHLALVKGDYTRALQGYERADAALGEGIFKDHVAQVYRLMGHKRKADALVAARIRELEALGRGRAGASYADGELAELYEGCGHYDKALYHALREWRRRPRNIDVNGALAWIYYRKGDLSQAVRHMQSALRTGTRNPVFLAHAGLIYAQSGQEQKARPYLAVAGNNHSSLDPELAKEVRRAAASLTSQNRASR